MATLTIPITVEQIRELAKQLSPQERQALIDSLLSERFDAVLGDADRKRRDQSAVTDEEIQAEVDAVRGHRREDRRRAAGH
jgi:ABC-type amino acid transport substrate-binding protein